ncbi:hypothetical protein BC629DRAFT_1596607 [Irpex lacteus]|nr:hypothetical protein BC629DRAFT_1596607 [Irpex lacteus]
MAQHTSDFNRADVCGIIAHAAFESVVIVLTYIRITHIRQSLRSIGQESDGRSRLLWRHGIIHFISLMFLDVLGLMGKSNQFEMLNDIPSITDTLMSILVSRFILALRNDHKTGGKAYTDRPLYLSETTSVCFATPRSSRLIGNLGASLRLCCDEDEDGECSEKGQEDISEDDSLLHRISVASLVDGNLHTPK